MSTTFGPAYDPALDQQRLTHQRERVCAYMLMASAVNRWQTLREIEDLTGYPQASISAQLRHLRKPAFGGYIVRKRRRGPNLQNRGIWEYIVFERPVQNELEFKR